jgi:periplasmic divalent cation tolerance protein
MDLAALYSTFPSAEAAETAARALVTEGLVACANILPGAVSMYRWEGAMQREPEVVMMAKTTRAGAPAAAARLKELHPYTTPAITWWDIAGSDPAYAAWVGESLRPRT